MNPFAAIAARVAPGAELLATVPLTGGVSADVSMLEIARPDGQRQKLVVRSFGAADWRTTHGPRVEREAAALRELGARGLPVPALVHFDDRCALLPAPYLVMEFVDGRKEFTDAARLPVLGRALREIHATSLVALEHLPSRLDPMDDLLDFVPSDSTELRTALLGLSDTAYRGPHALLHGDFWLGNILWRGANLVAILDWEDCAVGDPLSDVAAAALELRYRFDAAEVQRFLDAYFGNDDVDVPRLALWSVYVTCAASRYMDDWGLDPEFLAHMHVQADRVLAEASAVLWP